MSLPINNSCHYIPNTITDNKAHKGNPPYPIGSKLAHSSFLESAKSKLAKNSLQSSCWELTCSRN